MVSHRVTLFAILDHYLSILKVLDSISRQKPTIDLTWVLTQVVVKSASFLRIAITSQVVCQSSKVFLSLKLYTVGAQIPNVNGPKQGDETKVRLNFWNTQSSSLHQLWFSTTHQNL